MLFNSIEFLFVFLPLTVVGYRLLRQFGYDHVATIWLTLLSLGFYGWWNPPYLLLLLGSIAVNYTVGCAIQQAPQASRSRRYRTQIGIGFNLVLIGYYKYANFFLDTIDHSFGVNVPIEPIILPLAISFFTFQQIAYLIDVDRGHAPPYTPITYTLFVTFFPQLIAGPIVHHHDIMPQFERAVTDSPTSPNTSSPTPTGRSSHHLAVGLTIFTLGLIKKIWIADPISTISSPLFDTASTGQILTCLEAWSATLFYTFQLYFDFSGYSDMAIGAARLFGIILPMNFDSPYKATSISDFWRRWHITLSNFLRDYLYIPLGGSRSGNPFLNLWITMLLGGLWHGAGWTFVVWGGLHGIYLGVHRAWRLGWEAWRDRFPSVSRPSSRLATRLWQQSRFGLAWGATFLAVSLSWVIFRSDRLATAASILESNFRLNGNALGEPVLAHGAIAATLFLIVLWAPNLLDIMHRYEPAIGRRDQNPSPLPRWLLWHPKPWLGIPFGILIFCALQTLLLAPESEFLYFQF
ncbi:MAG: MBOAT family protein [Oscillatoriales cyanobacterium]|nr:MAG: MBOAT family protein [Oscillatoriales cyanobacterium]